MQIIMVQNVRIVPEVIVNGIVQTVSVRVHNQRENGMLVKKHVFVRKIIMEITVPIVREQMLRGTVPIKNVYVLMGCHGVYLNWPV